MAGYQLTVRQSGEQDTGDAPPPSEKPKPKPKAKSKSKPNAPKPKSIAAAKTRISKKLNIPGEEHMLERTVSPLPITRPQSKSVPVPLDSTERDATAAPPSPTQPRIAALRDLLQDPLDQDNTSRATRAITSPPLSTTSIPHPLTNSLRVRVPVGVSGDGVLSSSQIDSNDSFSSSDAYGGSVKPFWYGDASPDKQLEYDELQARKQQEDSDRRSAKREAWLKKQKTHASQRAELRVSNPAAAEAKEVARRAKNRQQLQLNQNGTDHDSAHIDHELEGGPVLVRRHKFNNKKFTKDQKAEIDRETQSFLGRVAYLADKFEVRRERVLDSTGLATKVKNGLRNPFNAFIQKYTEDGNIRPENGEPYIHRFAPTSL